MTNNKRVKINRSSKPAKKSEAPSGLVPILLIAVSVFIVVMGLRPLIAFFQESGRHVSPPASSSTRVVKGMPQSPPQHGGGAEGEVPDTIVMESSDEPAGVAGEQRGKEAANAGKAGEKPSDGQKPKEDLEVLIARSGAEDGQPKPPGSAAGEAESSGGGQQIQVKVSESPGAASSSSGEAAQKSGDAGSAGGEEAGAAGVESEADSGGRAGERIASRGAHEPDDSGAELSGEGSGAAEPAKPGGPLYIVQVGTFTKKPYAERLAKRLEKKGYATVIKEFEHSRLGQVQVVQLEPVSDPVEAGSLKRRLEEEENIEPMIVPVKPE
jgi:hypothetical protein